MPSKPKNSEDASLYSDTQAFMATLGLGGAAGNAMTSMTSLAFSEKDLDFDMDFSNGEDQPKKGQKTETMNKDSKISELKKVTLSTKVGQSSKKQQQLSLLKQIRQLYFPNMEFDHCHCYRRILSQGFQIVDGTGEQAVVIMWKKNDPRKRILAHVQYSF